MYPYENHSIECFWQRLLGCDRRSAVPVEGTFNCLSALLNSQFKPFSLLSNLADYCSFPKAVKRYSSTINEGQGIDTPGKNPNSYTTFPIATINTHCILY